MGRKVTKEIVTKFSHDEVRQAIHGKGKWSSKGPCYPTRADLAWQLGITTGTASRYLKIWPDLEAELEANRELPKIAAEMNARRRNMRGRGTAKRKFTKEDTLQAVHGEGRWSGMGECKRTQAALAERLGVSDRTASKYCSRYPELAKAMGYDPQNSITRYTEEQVKQAIQGTGAWEGDGPSYGNRSVIQKRLGVFRTTMDEYLLRWPSLQDEIEYGREGLADHAEHMAAVLISEGVASVVMFTLSAHPAAKARGWGKRNEIVGPGEGPLEISVTYGSLPGKDNSSED